MLKIKGIYILILIMTAQLLAQELPQLQIIGKPEKSPTEFVSTSIKDANGRVCAAIQVLSNLDGLKYDSYNGVVRADHQPGRDMVYLQPDERVLEVLHIGYQPLKIILSEIGIQLKPKDVWVLKIQGKITGDIIHVTILVEPKDATVQIDGKQVGSGPTYKLSKGRHRIELTRVQYQPIKQEIDVSDDKVFFQFTLDKKQDAGVQITTVPPGATVFLDGLEVGQTPAAIFYPEGRYTLRIEKKGYVDLEEPLVVRLPSVTKQYTLEENIGYITIHTDRNAKVFIDGQEVQGNTKYKVPPRLIRVKATLPKAEPVEKQVIIKRNEHLTVELYPVVPTGTIQVAVSPFDAKVELRGDAGEYYTAEGMRIFKDIPVGAYELAVSKNGYGSQREKVQLHENEKMNRSIRLEVTRITQPSASSVTDMVYVEGGTFQMGSNVGGSNEKPVHSVTVSGFYMSKYEVTQKEWQEAMGTNPSKVKGDNLPVEQVSWYDAVNFCNAKSRKEGLTPCYTINGNNVTCAFSANGYRLPTEAEWEYAARGGKQSKGYKYSGSNNAGEVAWYWDNSSKKTHPVGQKIANELGIYDMSGNVYEWCWDWYNFGFYSQSPGNNPSGPMSGSRRVIRGGSWYGNAADVRVAYRSGDGPSYSYIYIGFRLCRTE